MLLPKAMIEQVNLWHKRLLASLCGLCNELPHDISQVLIKIGMDKMGAAMKSQN